MHPFKASGKLTGGGGGKKKLSGRQILKAATRGMEWVDNRYSIYKYTNSKNSNVLYSNCSCIRKMSTRGGREEGNKNRFWCLKYFRAFWNRNHAVMYNIKQRLFAFRKRIYANNQRQFSVILAEKNS